MPVVPVERAGEQARASDFSQSEGTTEPSVFTRFAQHPTLPKNGGIHYTPFPSSNDEGLATWFPRFSAEESLSTSIRTQWT